MMEKDLSCGSTSKIIWSSPNVSIITRQDLLLRCTYRKLWYFQIAILKRFLDTPNTPSLPTGPPQRHHVGHRRWPEHRWLPQVPRSRWDLGWNLLWSVVVVVTVWIPRFLRRLISLKLGVKNHPFENPPYSPLQPIFFHLPPLLQAHWRRRPVPRISYPRIKGPWREISVGPPYVNPFWLAGWITKKTTDALFASGGIEHCNSHKFIGLVHLSIHK